MNTPIFAITLGLLALVSGMPRRAPSDTVIIIVTKDAEVSYNDGDSADSASLIEIPTIPTENEESIINILPISSEDSDEEELPEENDEDQALDVEEDEAIPEEDNELSLLPFDGFLPHIPMLPGFPMPPFQKPGTPQFGIPQFPQNLPFFRPYKPQGPTIFSTFPHQSEQEVN